MAITTERLVNFPAIFTPHGGDIVYVGDSTNSFNEVKVTIDDLTSASALVLKVANNLSDVASASASRTNLGLGSAATHADTDFLLAANNLSDLTNVVTARANLGLGSAAVLPVTDFLLAANNLSDLVSASTARTNLGLGNAAVKTVSDGAQNIVSSVVGSTTIGHVAVFSDVTGSIQDGGASSQFLLAANNLSDVANVTTSRANLGLGDAAVKGVSNNALTTVPTISGAVVTGHYAKFADNVGTLTDGGASPAGVLLSANNLSDVASISTSRTNLGLGTAAVADQSSLTGIVAAVTGPVTTGHYAKFSDTAGTLVDGGLSPAGVLLSANNLSDVADVPTSRTNLGLGTAAVQNVAFFLQSANNLSDVQSASASRTNLGLGTAAVKAASDAAQPSVASLIGPFTIGNVAVFADVNGTLQDGGTGGGGGGGFTNSFLMMGG